MPKRVVVFGLVGSTMDRGAAPDRWDRWRPSVSVVQHEDFQVHRYELLFNPSNRPERKLAELLTADIQSQSPETVVQLHEVHLRDAWDFAEVYEALGDLAERYPFAVEHEDYYLHITTGTHVVQICLFLLAETRVIPARLLQTAPQGKREGGYSIIDLDLGKYDRLLARTQARALSSRDALKAGIATVDEEFNRTIAELEEVATKSRDPLLLLGETGTGKSALAARVYQLKKARHQFGGEFVAVNCATLRGDGAMSALFGHVKGAFTGANSERGGLLKKAHGGLLFLDEVAELGADEQAMLLTAIESKRFYPVGADRETTSDFQLIVGTHRDLEAEVAAGRFRDDLLARISLWPFALPPLRARKGDIEPNLDYELEQASVSLGIRVTFLADARREFLRFAVSSQALWPRNFRDFAASVRRMATLSPGARIGLPDVSAELRRLSRGVAVAETIESSVVAADSIPASWKVAATLLGDQWATVDRFDKAQLAEVIAVCQSAESQSAAGRLLFANSLDKRASRNDAARLGKYLRRWGLSFTTIQSE